MVPGIFWKSGNITFKWNDNFAIETSLLSERQTHRNRDREKERDRIHVGGGRKGERKEREREREGGRRKGGKRETEGERWRESSVAVLILGGSRLGLSLLGQLCETHRLNSGLLASAQTHCGCL